MEIKPADKEIIDHKDLRYKRKVSNRGIKEMNKQAYEHTVGLVLSKQAGTQELWDAVKKHVANNRLAYLGGATGAVLGSLSAIGGPWWRYLTSGGAGAAVGAGIGYAGDRIRKNLEEENRQLSVDRDLLTNENNELLEANRQLKNEREKAESTAMIMKALAAAKGADVGESVLIPQPLSQPGAPHNSY